MSAFKVLYVGGTGTISWSSVMRSVALGQAVTVMNRGRSLVRPLPAAVELLEGDATDSDSMRTLLAGREFDAVVNFLTFTGAEAEQAEKIFAPIASHYVHISTAALYEKPPRRMPYLESTPRHNPNSSYASQKIAAEDALLAAYFDRGFPVTIVRPSHTYDDAHPPLPGDWTLIDRIARGEEIVVPGDGTSLWTLTHAEDFAVGLVGLLGNRAAFGEAFHITSEFAYSWDQIYGYLAAAMATTANIVHVPTELIALAAPTWIWSELIAYDLKYSVLLDNAKIRSYVPAYDPQVNFAEGARRIISWRSQHPAEAVGDGPVDAIFTKLAGAYHDAAAIFQRLGA
jgi:nucleoside-diphosphate-sugar epimerase